MPHRVESFLTKMRADRVSDLAMACFSDYYAKVERGEIATQIDEDSIESIPADMMLDFDELPVPANSDVSNTVMIKLNGGLGTSMGLQRAKSLLPVRDELTFLDIIARQVLTRKACLLLMNSYATRGDTLAYLERYPDLRQPDLPLDFVQNKFPRIRKETGLPLDFGDARDWNPPGHGDMYLALQNDDLLRRLIKAGYRYAFVSNADNLGATLDARIPAAMSAQGVPFLMEVCRRGEMDKKGGHLARRKADGRLILRETAQRPSSGADRFEDIDMYRWFNTNNLWIDLPVLQAKLEAGAGRLNLPLIRNPKTVDGIDVIQFETAVGAAVELFENARAMVVPRSRFFPVKKTNDLLLLRSDVFRLDAATGTLEHAPGCERLPVVDLAPEHYGTVADLERLFPEGIPSLVQCTSLRITRPVLFRQGVVFAGNVEIHPGPAELPPGNYTGRIHL